MTTTRMFHRIRPAIYILLMTTAFACANDNATTTPLIDGGVGVDTPARDAARRDADTPRPVAVATNAFGAFHFTIDTRPPSDQIDFLMGLGYVGAMIKWPGRNGYLEYAHHPAVRNGSFKIVAVLFDLNLDVPVDIPALRDMAHDLATTDTALWTLVFGPKDTQRITTAAAILADTVIGVGVTVVLYPHDETAIEDVEESMTVLRLARRTNLKTSLHLCHEFKAGNRDRIAEVIAAGKDAIVLATINGTFQDAEFVPGWDRGILPLDVGDFDVGTFYLRPLLQSGYTGPILLHTFGIKETPEEHFARSIARWRAMRSELADAGF